MAATGTVVRREGVRVVELRPGVLGEDLGDLAMRLQPAVVLEHPREDVLGGEVPLGLDDVGLEPVRRPPGRDAVGVARLVERRVDRIPREAHARLDVVQPRQRAERQLDDVMEMLEAVAVAELEAELAEAA